jgi:di/tricarboxylate transporter
MPAVHHARSALVIFAAVIGSAALGVVPIEIATLVGAGAMLATGVLNIRQAARAIDRTIVMMIAAALALGSALQATGGAEFLAVVFAANCSFASPVGYQTNLLVMAPGNYRFVDFIRVGSPFVIIVCLTFSLVASWYYGLI